MAGKWKEPPKSQLLGCGVVTERRSVSVRRSKTVCRRCPQRRRKGLRQRLRVALATGTGKTSIAFQIAWKLFNARWNLKEWKSGAVPTRRPRILFLADRNNLADQAFNDFTSFAAFNLGESGWHTTGILRCLIE